MLHGSYKDSSKFWGETLGGDEFEAVSIHNIPGKADGTIVFAGCCWGALTAQLPAMRSRDTDSPTQKSIETSMALSYLKAGAQAFVGCTGSHYSPLQPPFNYYGKPMHDHFWAGISSGLKPAQALFNAKVAYAKEIPHGRTDAFSRAVELKIFHQFTCLGLGW